jgi:hypothetical protein
MDTGCFQTESALSLKQNSETVRNALDLSLTNVESFYDDP